MKSEICMILAVGPTNSEGKSLIGLDDGLAWHSKKDFKFFKETTLHYPCIFGDKTFFNMPTYPLKDRLNIVTSLDYTNLEVGQTEKGFYIQVPDIKQAIDLASNYSKVFICGGASIYKYVFENNLVDTIYLTKIDGDVYGNRYLNINNFVETLDTKWKLVEFKRESEPEEGLELTFNKYINETH